MSTLYVDNLQPNLGSGVHIPGHVIQVQALSRVSTAKHHFSSTAAVILNDGVGNFQQTITPNFSNSKIVGYVNLSGIATTSSGNSIGFMIYRNGSFIQTIDNHFSYNYDEDSDRHHLSYQFIDTPNSTSAVTYSIYIKPRTTGTVVIFDTHVSTPSNATNNLILQEIAQ